MEGKRGRWIGILEIISAPVTFVLASNNGKYSVIKRLVLQSATNPISLNLFADKMAYLSATIIKNIPNINPSLLNIANDIPNVGPYPIKSCPG